MNFEHLDDPVEFRPDDSFRAATLGDGRRRRRRRRLALTSGTLLTSLLAMVVVAGGYGLWRTSQIDRVPVEFATEPIDLGDPFNILLVGTDQRSDPAEQVVGARSDTMIVLRVEPQDRRVVMLSLPRDLVVPSLDGGDLRRLNQALLEGGASKLVGTVEQGLGIPLSAFAMVDFDGVVDLVDETGGLLLAVSATVRDKSTGLYLDESTCSTVDGMTALALLRSRHLEILGADGRWVEDASSDLGRMARQRSVLATLLPRLGGLSDSFGGIDAALSVLDDHVTVDARFSVEAMARLARWATEGETPTLEEVLLPVSDATTGSGARVLQLGPGADQAITQAGGTLPESTAVGSTLGSVDPNPYLGSASGPAQVPIGPCS